MFSSPLSIYSPSRLPSVVLQHAPLLPHRGGHLLGLRAAVAREAPVRRQLLLLQGHHEAHHPGAAEEQPVEVLQRPPLRRLQQLAVHEHLRSFHLESRESRSFSTEEGESTKLNSMFWARFCASPRVCSQSDPQFTPKVACKFYKMDGKSS